MIVIVSFNEIELFLPAKIPISLPIFKSPAAAKRQPKLFNNALNKEGLKKEKKVQSQFL